jgi:protein SCO1/2
MSSARPCESLARWCSGGLCLTLLVLFLWGAWRQTYGLKVWTFEGHRQMQLAAGELQASAVPLRDAGGATAAAPWTGSVPAAYLVDFIYTRCPGVCRALGSEYQQMQRQLIARAHTDPAYRGVQLLSVSFDVAYDNVPQLQRATVQWGALPALWRFVVPASAADARTLLRSLGVVAIPDGQGGFAHNGDIHLLDRQGRLRGLFAFDEWPLALQAAQQLAAR